MRYLLLLCFLALLSGCKADKSSVPNDERIGDQIIAALDKYKTEQGLYPDTLTQLVPNYITKITPPRYGEKRWDYIHYCKKDTFALFMWGQKAYEDGYWYDPDKGKWGVAENSF